MTTAWWQGLGALDTAGPPGAEDHRLRWSDGGLQLVAHPDPDADRAMHALGAPVCPCLPMLDAWERAHLDGGFLVVGSRDPAERLPVPSEAIALLTADLARWQGAIAALDPGGEDRAAVERLAAAAAPAEADARRRLGALLLLALDPRLQVRLQASIAATLAHGPALEVATAGRAIAPLQAIGWTGDRSGIRLGEPAIEGHEATLPAGWIPRVWASGLANAVPGHLVVDVTSVTPGGPAEVLALAPGKSRIVFRVDRWENA